MPIAQNCQINYAKEFDYSIKLAKRKRNPRKYFAFIWPSANLADGRLAAQIDCSGESFQGGRERHKQKMQEQVSISIDGLNKLAQMKRSYNL